MYEIWSLGHKPFEGYTNAQVGLCCNNDTTVLFLFIVLPKDYQADRQQVSSPSTSWLPQRSLQNNDPLLVSNLSLDGRNLAM